MITSGADTDGDRLRASRSEEMFDSVPPLVMNPTASGFPSSEASILTACFSISYGPGCSSRAHSTKKVPSVISYTFRVIGCGGPT